MRVYILIALFIGMSIYAWRNWFIPLCVLIIFDAVMKHDDMPRSLFGIQGLNLWNILLICVFLSWLVSRLSAPAPAPGARVSKAFILLCAAYMGIIVIAAIRGMLDGSSIRSGNEDYSFDFQWRYQNPVEVQQVVGATPEEHSPLAIHSRRVAGKIPAIAEPSGCLFRIGDISFDQ